jgi:hypothetical protein
VFESPVQFDTVLLFAFVKHIAKFESDTAEQFVTLELLAAIYNDLPLIDDVLHLSIVAVEPITYTPGPAILDAEQLLTRVFAVFLVRIPYEDVLEL